MAGKTTMLGFRLPTEIAEKLEKTIVSSGFSKAEYFRRIILSRKDQVIIKTNFAETPQYKKMLLQVNKVGNNINQIAKHINSSNIVNKEVDIKQIHLDLLAIENHLVSILSLGK